MKYVFVAFVLISLVLYSLVCLGTMSNEMAIGLPIFLAFAELMIWFHYTQKTRYGSWMHPVIFFFFSYMIVYFQVPYSYICFGLEDSFPRVDGYEYIAHGAVLSLVGLSFFFLGYAALFSPEFKSMTLPLQTNKEYFFTPEICQGIISLLLPFAVIFGFLAIVLNPQLLAGEYGTRSDYSVPWYVAIFTKLAKMQFTIICTLETIRLLHFKIINLTTYFHLYNKKVLILAMLFILPYLRAGDRGEFLYMGVIVCAPYYLFFHRLNFVLFASVLLLSSIFLTYVGATRTGDASNPLTERISDTIMMKDISLSPLRPDLWPTRELASSYQCYVCAMDLKYSHALPSNFFPGRYSLYSFLRFSPDYVLAYLPFYHNTGEYPELGGVITDKLQRGRRGESGVAGLGSVSLAEPLVDFGDIGVPIYFFLFGAFLYWLEKSCFKNLSVYGMMGYIFFTYQVIYVNRSEILSVWSIYFWNAVELFMIQIFFRINYSTQWSHAKKTQSIR